MTTQLYRKADRADEVADLNLKDADPAAIIAATYDAWDGMLDDYLSRPEKLEDNNVILENKEDWFYDKARGLLTPYREKLRGVLTENELRHVADRRRCLAGLYISALLNETDISMLSLGPSPAIYNLLGWRLKPGKTLEIRGVCKAGYVAPRAEGGVVILRKRSSATEVGHMAEGGTFLLYNKLPPNAFAEGGLFVLADRGIVLCDEDTARRRDVIYGIESELHALDGMDVKLRSLYDKILAAGEAPDIPRVEKLARKIRKNLMKRKIA